MGLLQMKGQEKRCTVGNKTENCLKKKKKKVCSDAELQHMRGLQALLLLKTGKEFVLLIIHLVKIAKVTWLHLFHELHKYM